MYCLKQRIHPHLVSIQMDQILNPLISHPRLGTWEDFQAGITVRNKTFQWRAGLRTDRTNSFKLLTEYMQRLAQVVLSRVLAWEHTRTLLKASTIKTTNCLRSPALVIKQAHSTTVATVATYSNQLKSQRASRRGLASRMTLFRAIKAGLKTPI